MNDDLLETALVWAKFAHKNQKRKENGNPYICHIFDVAKILENWNVFGHDIFCAAYLHDIVEDTPVSIIDIEEEFGDEIANLVACLTKPEIDGSRDLAVQSYSQQLFVSPYKAQIIKAADIAANAKEIKNSSDESWKIRFVREKMVMLSALTKVEADIWIEVLKILNSVFDKE